jgi:hypothetical protein
MTPPEGSSSDEGREPRRSGSAWEEAKRRVRERNDSARKAGKEERRAAERRTAAFERAQRERGIVR